MAIDGNTILVGAPMDDNDGDGSGSTYVFDATSGAQIRKITTANAAAGDRFGAWCPLFLAPIRWAPRFKTLLLHLRLLLSSLCL